MRPTAAVLLARLATLPKPDRVNAPRAYPSLNHLVRTQQQRLRDRDSERIGASEIYGQRRRAFLQSEKQPLLQRRIIHRDKLEGPPDDTAYVTQPWEGNVGTANQVPILDGVREGPVMLACCQRSVNVVADGDGRVVELHRCDVHYIAPQDELLVLALNHVHGVPGRVSVCGFRTHTGDEFDCALEHLELARIKLRIDRGHRRLKETSRRFRRSPHVSLTQPVIGVALVDADDRIRKGALSARY